MARKKIVKEVEELSEEEIGEIEELFEEVVKPVEYYKIKDANRLRLRLEEGNLDGAGFDGVEIRQFDMRTASLKGCTMDGATFRHVNMQGCDFSGVIKCAGNTFIDCDLRWGKKPVEFEGNNTFINTRL